MKKFLKIVKYLLRCMKILSEAGKVYLFVVVLFAIISGALPGLSTLIMQKIVNVLQIGNRDLEYVLKLIAIYISIDLFKAIVGMLSVYIDNVLLMKATIAFNMSVVEKVKEFTLKDFENSGTYDLIKRASDIDISKIYGFFKSFVSLIQSIINLTIFSLILLSWRWWIIPIIISITIINTFFTVYFGKKQFYINKNRTGKTRKLWYYKFLLTYDFAFKEISIFNLGDYLRSKYKKLIIEFLKQDRKILNQKTIVQSFLLLVEQVIFSFLFIYVVLNTFFGKLMFGDMTAYIRSISSAKSCAQEVLNQLNLIYKSMLDISLYFDLIDMKTDYIESGGLLQVNNIRSVEVKNLSYRYKDQNRYALNNISLKFEAGSIVALIGQNGSGKTTFMKILSTLYNDYKGEIYFGDNNLRELNIEEVRKKIGLLFQDFVKYEFSARENVAFGQLDKINNNELIAKALLETGMQDIITDLDVQLGAWFDDGLQMSGGEWLKIALSRAFIRDANIYLLDEPNAALDAISERKILDSFKKLCEGKIGVIISHRIASIIDIADKIIVFDNGSIQAEGTHEELIKNSPIYREMCISEEGFKAF